MEGQRVIFNVCGKRFESNVSVIEAHPDTLLAMLIRHIPSESNEVFIQRDAKLFRWILYWYSSGILVDHTTAGVPKEVWDAEVDYYTLFSPQEAQEEDKKRALPPLNESHELAAIVKKRAVEVNASIQAERDKRKETWKAILEHMVPNMCEKEGYWTAWELIGRSEDQKWFGWPSNYPVALRELDLNMWNSFWEEFKEYANDAGLNVKKEYYNGQTTSSKYSFLPASLTSVKTGHQDFKMLIRFKAPLVK